MPSEVHPEDCRSIFGCAGPKIALERKYKKERKKTIHAFSDVPRRKCP